MKFLVTKLCPKKDILGWRWERVSRVFNPNSLLYRERQLDTDVKDRFLLGAGFGLRVNMGSAFSMQLDLGYPLGDKSADEDQKQVHISLRAGF